MFNVLPSELVTPTTQCAMQTDDYMQPSSSGFPDPQSPPHPEGFQDWEELLRELQMGESLENHPGTVDPPTPIVDPLTSTWEEMSHGNYNNNSRPDWCLISSLQIKWPWSRRTQRTREATTNPGRWAFLALPWPTGRLLERSISSQAPAVVRTFLRRASKNCSPKTNSRPFCWSANNHRRIPHGESTGWIILPPQPC